MDIKKTANLFIDFTSRRLAEIAGLLLLLLGLALFVALFTYSPEDPNFIFPDNTEIKNFFGFKGSFVSDLFFQSVGLIAYLISLTFIITGINLLRSKEFILIIENIFFAVLYCLFGTLFLTYFYSDAFTLYINGNGGFVGNYINHTFLNSLIQINETIFFYFLILLTIILFLISINFHPINFFLTIKKLFKSFKEVDEKQLVQKKRWLKQI